MSGSIMKNIIMHFPFRLFRFEAGPKKNGTFHFIIWSFNWFHRRK